MVIAYNPSVIVSIYSLNLNIYLKVYKLKKDQYVEHKFQLKIKWNQTINNLDFRFILEIASYALFLAFLLMSVVHGVGDHRNREVAQIFFYLTTLDFHKTHKRTQHCIHGHYLQQMDGRRVAPSSL